MTDILIIASLALFTILLQFYKDLRSQKLYDRMTDKLLALHSAQSFTSYAINTPTAKEEYSFRPHPNGKATVPPSGEYNLPDNLEII